MISTSPQENADPAIMSGVRTRTRRRQPSTAMQASVLALNRNWLAVHVLSVPRAFCLLFKGHAEVVSVEDGLYQTYDFEAWRELSELKASLGEPVEEDSDWISAVSFDIQVPRIVRLTAYDRIPTRTIKFNRRNIFLRDDHRCQYCGKRFSMKRLSLDHVLPRSRGGGDSWENLVCACVTCNVRKGGRTPREAGMRLLTQPVRPRQSPLISRHLLQRKYGCWRQFLPAATPQESRSGRLVGVH
ncbi:CRISPR-associated endonuclease Cas9 [Maioricimonas rarisocia]|uniref:CRISPR-associated endonuclease Cas9 n=1 Tax=Maioricimonas rarisocia TaxID=2528026 RepID=A0A517Z083_9PLAN|nr:HNH endonuclease [Maioricimonas rarisocia]QDU35902.1 CRISPR-associated endonuclease Cas9 [Maioricimonas rarisocia]